MLSAIILLLIAVPPAFGLLALSVRSFPPRRVVIVVGLVVQAGLAVLLAAVSWESLPLSIDIEIPGLDYWCAGADIALALVVAAVAVRRKSPLTLLLAAAQLALSILSARFTGGVEATRLVVVDQMSLILVLIVGIVGGLVLFDATGYMQIYQQEHADVKDRRRVVGCVMLGFLGAMYGIILLDDLRAMLVCWELTTLASFYLIGYAGDAESRRNAFHALNLNVFGGLAFSIAIMLLASSAGTVNLSAIAMIAREGNAGAVIAPVALLALAGLVKSAQLPFTSWLLGAMVAPTPVSALLHSSTMVKAGVYLILRLAPALCGSPAGYLIAFIGILTFIAGAFAAISQRNAKRVLALSTVSNLGLIVACAGIGTYQLVWVALFLVVFHAVAKALLFLSVGTVSMATGSLDIEDMGGLILSMPRVAIVMIVGISAMFVAPFGMLVSKWAAMEAFINMNSLVSPLMIVLLAFGSSTTVLFWAKWLGVLIRMPDPKAPRGLLERSVTRAELSAEIALAIIAVGVCALFPLISKHAVEPFLLDQYARVFRLDSGNAFITVLMVVMILVVPSALILVSRRRTTEYAPAYMSGRPSGQGLSFSGSAGETRRLETRSYYLTKLFDEKRLLGLGTWVGILLVITTIGTVLL